MYRCRVAVLWAVDAPDAEPDEYLLQIASHLPGEPALLHLSPTR